MLNSTWIKTSLGVFFAALLLFVAAPPAQASGWISVEVDEYTVWENEAVVDLTTRLTAAQIDRIANVRTTAIPADGTTAALCGTSICVSGSFGNGLGWKTLVFTLTDEGGQIIHIVYVSAKINDVPVDATLAVTTQRNVGILHFVDVVDPSPQDLAGVFYYSYDCDITDGIFNAPLTTQGQFVCYYPDNGTYQARATIQNIGMAQGIEKTLSVTIDSYALPPTANLVVPTPKYLTERLTFNEYDTIDALPLLTEADGVDLDYASYFEIDKGEVYFCDSEQAICWDHQLGNNGLTSATLRVYAPNKALLASLQVTLDVKDVPPTAEFVHTWDDNVATIEVVNIYDPSPEDLTVLYYDYDCNSDGIYEAFTTRNTYQCKYKLNGEYMVTIAVRTLGMTLSQSQKYTAPVVLEGFTPDVRDLPGYPTYWTYMSETIVANEYEPITGHAIFREGLDLKLQFADRFTTVDPNATVSVCPTNPNAVCLDYQTGEGPAMRSMRILGYTEANDLMLVIDVVINVQEVKASAQFTYTTDANVATITLTDIYDPSDYDLQTGVSYWFDCQSDGRYDGFRFVSLAPQFECTYPGNGVYMASIYVYSSDYFLPTNQPTYKAPITIEGYVAPPVPPSTYRGFITDITMDENELADEVVITEGLQGLQLDFADRIYATAGRVHVCSDNPDALCLSDFRAGNGPSTQSVQAFIYTDRNFLYLSVTTRITVRNVVPQAELVYTVEADHVKLQLVNIIEPSPADRNAGLRYMFDCANQGIFAITSTTPEARCPINANGTFVMRAGIADKQTAPGAENVYETLVTVTDYAAPIPQPEPEYPVGTRTVYMTQTFDEYQTLEDHAIFDPAVDWQLEFAERIYTNMGYVDVCDDQAALCWDHQLGEGPARGTLVLGVYAPNRPNDPYLVIYLTINVENVAPQGDLMTQVNGNKATMEVTNVVEPSTLDRNQGFFYRFDCNTADAIPPFMTSMPNFTCTYATGGDYNVSAGVFDRDMYGGVYENTLMDTVTITFPSNDQDDQDPADDNSGDDNSGDDNADDPGDNNGDDNGGDDNADDPADDNGDDNGGDDNGGDDNADDNSGDDNSGDDPADDNSGDNGGDDNADDNGGDDNSGDDPADDNSGDDNSGDDNSGDDNNGDDNGGDDNSGDDNSGDDNSGDDNADDDNGDDNNGDDNGGDDNSGDDNGGDDNNGDDNGGDDNSGDDNADDNGDDNSGDDNGGDDNSGDDNSGDDNSGDDNADDDNGGDDNSGDDNSGDDNSGDDNADDNSGDDNNGDDNGGDDNSGDDPDVNIDPDEPPAGVNPVDVCWIADRNGAETGWRVTNDNPVPLMPGTQAKVVFDWGVFDGAGVPIQSANRWDQHPTVDITTPLADRIVVRWYVWNNGIEGAMYPVEATATEADRCDDVSDTGDAQTESPEPQPEIIDAEQDADEESVINEDEATNSDASEITEPVIETPVQEAPAQDEDEGAAPSPEATESAVAFNAAQVCWVMDRNGAESVWRITNDNPVPLVEGTQMKVRYDGTVYDAQGTVLQSFEGYDNPTLEFTSPLAARIVIDSYTWNNGEKGTVQSAQATATDAHRCP